MKKYLYSFVIASLILMSATVVKASNEVYYTNRHNVEMTEQEYNNLIGLGFTERQIQIMDENEFLANKNIEGANVLSEATKYYKQTTITRNGITMRTVQEITREEALAAREQSHNQPTRGPVGQYYDGVTADSVLEVRAKIIGINNTYMRYKVDSEWLVVPSSRYYDIIGVGLEANKVQIGSTIMFKQSWLTSNDVLGEDTTGYPKSESTGGSAIIQLPSGNLEYLDAYLYYNITKKANVGTITELNACGDYAHAAAYVNPETLYSHYHMYVTGIDIDYPYDLDYSEMPPACAYFVGTW